MENYNIKINEQGRILIDNILINENIFHNEEIDYKPVEKEQQINDLFMWIGEALHDEKRSNDVYMMKEDLKNLEKLEDTYIFSSISTNEFISKSEDLEEFNKICEEILKLNSRVN